MGTRSLTVFEEYGKEIVVMYRQFDGYPSGYGLELAEFMAGIKMVNGITVGETARMANGVGCLAAQIVKNFKEDVGGIYLYPAGSRDCGEDYIYHVGGDTGKEPYIKVFCIRYGGGQELLFEGVASEVARMIKTE